MVDVGSYQGEEFWGKCPNCPPPLLNLALTVNDEMYFSSVKISFVALRNIIKQTKHLSIYNYNNKVYIVNFYKVCGFRRNEKT